MIIKQLYTNCLAQASYYIESDGEVAIIDPIRDISDYVNLIGSKKLKYILETHFHADFVSGHLELAKKYSDMWGSKWFMITNPTYGRWELSIYDEMPKSEDEAIQKRKETLNP